ncbi:hypothetical protein ETAA8_21310 [Anatilimnocola aggregata]|uniref:Uncharacterized protein n=1 Tax=Anatilimnocola aggregata TaxID=2528021 RepID=A0A517Y9X9_9BACT|nr:hypothetical protein [Anatilimnocola aggregata]QDU27047.1 hypothetical protein ETAA8_21310 [Anatilimnocola aggregata]
MVWLIEPVKATPAKIDEYLGQGSYQEWITKTREANEALADWDRYKNMVPVRAQAYVTGLGSLDADTLLKAGHDYSWGIQQIENGKKINQDQLQDIQAIRDMAEEALRIETGILKGAMIVAALNLYLTGQFRNAQQMAAEALPKIQKLKSALEKAKKNATEARIQQAINLGITIATLVFLPQLTVIKRVGVAVGTWALDKALGTDKTTPLRDTVSDGADYGEILAAGIEDWKWLTPAEQGAVKSAAKGLSVVGLYFDQDEVNNALKQVDIVRAVLNEAVASLKRVKVLIERLRPGMATWRAQLLASAKAVKEAKADAEQIRNNYRQLSTTAKWYYSSPVVWRAA